MIRESLITGISDKGIETSSPTYVMHKATGNEYRIEMVVRDATNAHNDSHIVIYRETKSPYGRWARQIEEFCDGRFEIIN